MCSIIYELLISTISSYFIGDSVKQFSIIIGIYMAAMGIGSWISRIFKSNIIYRFVQIELILGVVGAFSVPLCYIYFGYADYDGFNVFVFFLVGVIGVLTGLEIPLLTKIMEQQKYSEEGLSDILTLDYMGALVATLLFPFVLIPFLGVYKSSLIFGFINIAIGIFNYLIFREEISKGGPRRTIALWLGIALSALLLLVYLRSNQFLSHWNKNLFKHPVVLEESSPYQNIILTNNSNEFRLYLNGAIQFSSRDEFRYHETLVHIPAQNLKNIHRVLILGGGEGLAAREVLKYKEIQHVDLVDLDPSVTRLASKNNLFTSLNNDALSDERLRVINADAFRWLMDNQETYELIIIDLPDPTNEALSKLYSVPFYNLVSNHLAPDGIMVTQATSPELSPKAFWCIDKTIASTDLQNTYPYNVNVPSFGNWGFIMASRQKLNPSLYRKDIEFKFLEDEMMQHIFYFPKDIKAEKSKVKINTLDHPYVLDYYLDHWQSLQSNGPK